MSDAVAFPLVLRPYLNLQARIIVLKVERYYLQTLCIVCFLVTD